MGNPIIDAAIAMFQPPAGEPAPAAHGVGKQAYDSLKGLVDFAMKHQQVPQSPRTKGGLISVMDSPGMDLEALREFTHFIHGGGQDSARGAMHTALYGGPEPSSMPIPTAESERIFRRRVEGSGSGLGGLDITSNLGDGSSYDRGATGRSVLNMDLSQSVGNADVASVLNHEYSHTRQPDFFSAYEAAFPEPKFDERAFEKKYPSPVWPEFKPPVMPDLVGHPNFSAEYAKYRKQYNDYVASHDKAVEEVKAKSEERRRKYGEARDEHREKVHKPYTEKKYSHINHIRSPLQEAAAETGPGLGDLVFEAEKYKAMHGHPARHVVAFPGGAQADLEWMRRQAEQHGYLDGKSMDELLSTPEGQAWLKRAIKLPTRFDYLNDKGTP